MKIFDIKCQSCFYTWEDVAKSVTDIFKCKKCGQLAQPVLSGCNFSCDGTDPGFPTAYERWAKSHERKARE
jgi:hypothetical protein